MARITSKGCDTMTTDQLTSQLSNISAQNTAKSQEFAREEMRFNASEAQKIEIGKHNSLQLLISVRFSIFRKLDLILFCRLEGLVLKPVPVRLHRVQKVRQIIRLFLLWQV